MSAYFGLDFGSSSIKACQATVLGTKNYTVTSVGLASNTAGSLEFGDQVVTTKLQPVVKKLLEETKIRDRRVVVSIPESRVYSRIVSMPAMSDAELSSAIQWEAEQFVPVPVADVEVDYSIVRPADPHASDKKMLVYLVAAPKKYLQSLVDFLLSCGLDPIAVESEMVATTRALTFGVAPTSTLIVHMGALSTVLAIVDGVTLTFSYVTTVGGVALTRALSQSLSIPLPQAEEYKRTYGLDAAQLEGKVRKSLLVVVEQIASEMRKAIEYHATANKSRVSRIVLSGGGAYLPDFTTYFSQAFGGTEVAVADPFATAKPGRGVIIPRERAVYTVAAGLALRVF